MWRAMSVVRPWQAVSRVWAAAACRARVCGAWNGGSSAAQKAAAAAARSAAAGVRCMRKVVFTAARHVDILPRDCFVVSRPE